MPGLGKILTRFFYLLFFIVFVVYEILLAGLRVAWSILLPPAQWHPALIDFPLDCTNDIQITFLANIISLTPGTLTLEVSADKKYLLLHTLFFSDKARLIQALKRKFERPVMEIWP